MTAFWLLLAFAWGAGTAVGWYGLKWLDDRRPPRPGTTARNQPGRREP